MLRIRVSGARYNQDMFSCSNGTGNFQKTLLLVSLTRTTISVDPSGHFHFHYILNWTTLPVHAYLHFSHALPRVKNDLFYCILYIRRPVIAQCEISPVPEIMDCSLTLTHIHTRERAHTQNYISYI
jgi:hypothetical protein